MMLTARTALLTLLLMNVPASAAVNLELRPANLNGSTACGIVNIGLFAVSDNEVSQTFSAAQVIFSWDPTVVQLSGLDHTGAVGLADSFFPQGDPFGINEVVPPQDGDGLYVAFAPLGQSVAATAQGTLLTTLQFQALAVTPETSVDILASAGDPPTETKVFDPEVPGLDILGTFSGSVLAISESPTRDFNNDGQVGPFDLAVVLGAWGPCPAIPAPCPADVTCDGEVDASDLAAVLGAWGPV